MPSVFINTTILTQSRGAKIVLACGIAATTLGITVLLGWALQIPALVRIRIEWVPMVINTALCFVLAGIALLATMNKARHARRIQIAIGLFISTLASVVLIEVIFGLKAPWDLAQIHRPLQLDYQSPGQMAPNTALGFILFGWGVILRNTLSEKHTAWLRWISFGVLGIGLTGMFGYFLKLEVLYNWTGVVRMALHTGVGMSLLGLGLWHTWRDAAWNVDRSDRAEILRIHRISTGLLILAAVTAGVAGIALIQDRIESVMTENLSRMLKDRKVFFEQVLMHRSERAAVMAENPMLAMLVRQLDEAQYPETKAKLDEHAKRMQTHGFSSILFEGKHTRFAALEPLTAKPDLKVAIRGPYREHLLWKQGYVLRTQIPLRDEQGLAGYVIAEQPLHALSRMASEVSNWGSSGDMAVCVAAASNLDCFPIRTKPQAFTVPDHYLNQPLPMAYAVQQKSGVIKSLDFRGKRVLAAYSPIGDTGLGMVLKMDVAEIYAPIREQFQTALPFLALLVIFSTWFMRAQLRPLLHTLVSTRREAQENEARFVAAAEGSLDAFFILESVRDAHKEIRDFRFLFLNAPAVEMLELTDASAVGHTLSEALPAYRSNGCYEKYLRVLATSLPITEETTGANQAGTVWRRQQIVKLGDGVAVTLQDITERKRVEHLQHEFISTVSHELRTPLTAIRGALGLIMGGVLGELPPKAKDIIRIADQNSARLANLINDLLDMEKLIANGMRFDMQTQPLQPLVEQSIEANRSYAEQHQVQYEFIARAQDALVNIDSQRLLQVLANLLSNAAKFSPPGSKVEIAIYKRASEVQVSVTDYGGGIPADFQHRIFRKFSQADGSDTRQKGGTGLGLAISKELVEQMGGAIGFRSRLGQGACFYFTLPLAAETRNLPQKDSKINSA